MFNDEALRQFGYIFTMFGTFGIIATIVANMWANRSIRDEVTAFSMAVLFHPSEYYIWASFYTYGQGMKEITFTKVQSFFYWFILFCYSFGEIGFVLPMYPYNFIMLFTASCVSNFFFVSVYWSDEFYIKNFTAIFRIIMTCLLSCGMAFVSYLFPKGEIVATGQLFIFTLWTLWLVIADFLHNRWGHDMRRDIGMRAMTGRYFAAFIVGSIILVRSTNADKTASGTPSLFNVVRLMIFFSVSNFVGSTALSRYCYGDKFAALVFGIHLYLNFSLDILFISSNLLYADFWIVLLFTSGYHVFRNAGGQEDIAEWFRIKYGSSFIHEIIRTCTCSNDVDVIAEDNEHTNSMTPQQLKDENSKLLLMKTQAELIQLLTPCTLGLMILSDMIIVQSGYGEGSLTRGMTFYGRPYALMVVVITFIFKYSGVIISREILLSKKEKLSTNC